MALCSWAGCSSGRSEGSGARTITVSDFTNPEMANSSASIAGLPPQSAPTTAAAATSVPAASATAASEEDVETGADAPNVPLSERWLVDGFVGQVNGRPVFADELLDPIKDQLIQAAQGPNRATARDEFIRVVSRRFDAWVASALVVAEAESLLTTEEQQGLLAFMRNFQEEEIAKLGGSRTLAEQQVWEQEGISLESLMSRRRNEILAMDIIRKRVRPRVIVSWRDIEREYNRRRDEFSPPGVAHLSRISLNRQTEAEAIATARALFAEGKSFEEVADAVGAENQGKWNEVKLGSNGFADVDFVPAIKDRLVKLSPGETSESFDLGSNTVWIHYDELEQEPPRGIYDRDVQLALTNDLAGRRSELEEVRYIESLKRRWVADDLNDMKLDLMTIALVRYWR